MNLDVKVIFTASIGTVLTNLAGYMCKGKTKYNQNCSVSMYPIFVHVCTCVCNDMWASRYQIPRVEAFHFMYTIN